MKNDVNFSFLKMNGIEAKYVCDRCIIQQLPMKCFALCDDAAFDYGEYTLIKDFIEGWIIGENCWVVASVTPTNQIFVIHNILYNPEPDVRYEDSFIEDVMSLINSGRKIMIVVFHEQKVFFIKKKEGVEIDDFSTFNDIHFEILNWKRLVDVPTWKYVGVQY